MASAHGGAEAELQLIARIGQHDLHAFQTLYRCYEPRLTRFLHNFVRQPHIIEEVLDDLTSRIERLRVLYEQYFMGIEKLQPSTARAEVGV